MKRLIFITLCAVGSLLLVWGLKGGKKQPISFSDNLLFPAFCTSLSENEEAFNQFKRAPTANLSWENMSYHEGKSHLEFITAQFPELLASADAFRENDLLGNPRRFVYKKAGIFSPSTLRYMKMAGDLKHHFGSLQGLKILEIGGGYGGQCKVLSTLFSFKQYTIADLPGCLELSRKYLGELSVKNVSFSSLREVSKEKYDLIISDLSFGEMDRSLQKLYIEKVFSESRAGYLLLPPAHWKEIPFSETEHKRVKPYPKEKLIDLFRKQGFICEELPEEPATGKGYFILKLTRIGSYAL